MTLQETLKEGLTKAIKSRDPATAGVLKLAISELQREPQKVVPDERVVKILNKMITNEEEVGKAIAERKGVAYVEGPLSMVLGTYLPKEATEEEIRTWIKDNVDFTKYKNKMQAMKEIMSAFAGRTDGNKVKKILEST